MPTTTRAKSARDLTVTRTATRQDAELLVQIMSTPVAERASDGMELLFGYDKPPSYEQFSKDHPRGSDGSRCVNAVLNFNETIGTFVKNGLLDKDLVYDLLWVAGAWERCKAIALHHREESGEPKIYENFEWLATGQKD